jgi:hypothetical protein
MWFWEEALQLGIAVRLGVPEVRAVSMELRN